MEATLKYLFKNIILVIPVLILLLVSLYAYIYYFKKIEPFQDMNIISGGATIPTKLPKITCEAITTQITQYKQVKADNPDTKIGNLDETIESMTKMYVDGKCDEYT